MGSEAFGIFGVTADGVAQRRRAFGIGFALGPQRSHVGAPVLGRVGLLTASSGLARQPASNWRR